MGTGAWHGLSCCSAGDGAFAGARAGPRGRGRATLARQHLCDWSRSPAGPGALGLRNAAVNFPLKVRIICAGREILWVSR